MAMLIAEHRLVKDKKGTVLGQIRKRVSPDRLTVYWEASPLGHRWGVPLKTEQEAEAWVQIHAEVPGGEPR